jgi:hypothetical protein
MFDIHFLDMYNEQEEWSDFVAIVTGYGRIWHQGDHPNLKLACKEANRLMSKRYLTAAQAWAAASALIAPSHRVPGNMTTPKLADELADKRTYARLFASIGDNAALADDSVIRRLREGKLDFDALSVTDDGLLDERIPSRSRK